jgi:cephalosporin hydroxylase
MSTLAPHALKLAATAIELGASQKQRELSALLTRLKRRRLRRLAEIGTEKGGSFYAWCAIAETDALIVSIDLPGGEFGGGYPSTKLKKYRSYRRGSQRLKFIRADSHNQETADHLAQTLRGEQLDFLFIDGDHTYRGVRKDFEMYAGFVRPGGIIAFHDIVPHPKVPRCQVHIYWREVCKNFQHEEFVQPGAERDWGPWGGIGLIRLPRAHHDYVTAFRRSSATLRQR